MNYFTNFSSRHSGNISFSEFLGKVTAKKNRYSGSIKVARQSLRAQHTCINKTSLYSIRFSRREYILTRIRIIKNMIITSDLYTKDCSYAEQH